ncbi:MAG: CDP-diacylglycerol--serine O-phosphatidyltransferase [Acidobacteriota bacterium]|nr:CDP-diacylglycerol--serine O-phosphatidyltransferase [Acidobacteriota bacterium]
MNPHRRLLFVPNSVTAANIVVGFLSIVAAADGRFNLAVYLLFSALMLDMTDGILARKLQATSKFGQEMDSLGDSLSFCAAPAFLAYSALLAPLHGIGVALAASFVLAGVFRLARFNLTSNEHEKARWTTGVPTPIAAGYIMTLVLMRDRVPVPAAAFVVLLMAMLMLSRWHLPELRGRGAVTVALLIGIPNYLAVMIWPNWYTVGWWNAWNVVILLVARTEARREEPEQDLASTPL